jgi:hypothetical protein
MEKLEIYLTTISIKLHFKFHLILVYDVEI